MPIYLALTKFLSLSKEPIRRAYPNFCESGRLTTPREERDRTEQHTKSKSPSKVQQSIEAARNAPAFTPERQAAPGASC